MTIKKILVPVDFSEFSDLAVEYALFMAEKFGADMTIFHTILLFHHDIQEKEHLQNYENIIKHKEEEINIRFASQCSALRKRRFKVNSVLQRDFSAANSILNYLQEHNYDLIVRFRLLPFTKVFSKKLSRKYWCLLISLSILKWPLIWPR